MISMTPDTIFDLSGRVAIITGGAGLLGVQHAEAIAQAGGIPVLVDINETAAVHQAEIISQYYSVDCLGLKTDITKKGEIEAMAAFVLKRYNRIDILINNAANDPKVKAGAGNTTWSRFENFPIDAWHMDIAVGLTGAFLCTQVIGSEMARRKKGVILNISSDLGLIGPDQRIYAKDNLRENEQPVKPVTYSVIKSALIGLTRYSATYWADKNVRVNAICPGGVRTDQPDDFLEKLTYRIPMGRMARKDEYKGAVLFMVSDASSYMTGSVISVDGGRTCW